LVLQPDKKNEKYAQINVNKKRNIFL